MMPPLPEPYVPPASILECTGIFDSLFTKTQMTEYAQACIEAERERILRIVYEQSTEYGLPGECMWIGIKSRVRYT